MTKKTWTAAEMGRKGGKISKRVLTPEQAREMVRIREEKKRVLESIPTPISKTIAE